MEGFFSVNVYVFISVVLFLWLKIAKNCQKLIYMGTGEIFLFGILKIGPKSSKIHCLCIVYKAELHLGLRQTPPMFHLRY